MKRITLPYAITLALLALSAIILLATPAQLQASYSAAPDSMLSLAGTPFTQTTTVTSTATLTATATATQANTATATATVSTTATAAPTNSQTATATATVSRTATAAPTNSPTATATATSTISGTTGTKAPTKSPTAPVISGTVTVKFGDTASGQIQVFPAGQNTSQFSAPVQANGFYSVTVTPGNYDLRTYVTGYYPVSNSGLSITGDMTINFDLASNDPHRITGTITGLSPQQLADIWISTQPNPVQGTLSASMHPISTTGQYTLNVPGGSWTVIAGSVTGKVTPSSSPVNNLSGTRTGVNFSYVTGYLVSGTVTLPEGPAGTGSVIVRQAGAQVGSTSINASGNYSITLATGGYEIRTSISGYYPASTGSITVNADRTTNFDLSGYHRITGTVSGLSSGQLANIMITGQANINPPSPNAMSASVTPMTTTGTYMLSMPNGDWKVSAPAVSGKVTPAARTYNGFSSDVTGVNFDYVTGYVISGTVTLRNGAHPNTGSISVFQNGSSTSSSAAIQSNGTYSITLAASDYELRTSGIPGYYTKSSGTFALSSPITQNFDLSNYYSVSGTVSGLSQQQLSNLTVNLNPSSGMGFWANTTPISATGVYTIFAPGGSKMVSVGSVAGKVTPANRNINLASDTTGIDFSYVPGFVISGTVTLPGGNVPPNSNVQILLPGQNSSSQSATIQANGAYSVTLATGSYTLRTSVNGFYAQSIPLDNLAANTTVNFNLSTADPYPITGTISGLSQSDLSSLWVTVADSSSMGPGPNGTVHPISTTGAYTLWVPGGSWRVSSGSVNGKVAPQSQTVAVNGGTPGAVGISFAYLDGYAIGGSVTLRSGSQTQGSIMVFLPGQSFSSNSAPIQPNGSYSMTLTQGTYELRTSVDGYYPKSQTITPTQNSTVNFDLSAHDPYTITGSVSGISGLSANQWQNLWINVQDSNSMGPGPNGSVRPVQSTGAFTMFVPAGSWRVSPPQVGGFVAPQAQNAQTSSTAPSVSLPAFSFGSGYTISGTVAINGIPVSAWQGRVDAVDRTTGMYVGGATVQSGGAYSFTLASGSYTARAQVSGYYPPTVDFAPLTADQLTTNFDVAVSDPYTVTGRITGLSSQKLGQVQVSLQDAALNTPGPSAMVQLSGDAYTVRVPAGSWRVMGNQVSGNGRPNPVVVTTSSDNPTVTADLAYSSGWSITGTVKDPNNNPVAWAGVHLYNSDHSVDQFNNTNNSGSYEFGGLANGTYTVQATVPWGSNAWVAPAPATVTVSGGNVSGQNFSYTVSTKRIVGTVKKGSGAAVAGAEVFASANEGAGGVNGQTAADGSYTLSVGSGTWRVNVHPRYSSGAPDWNYSKPPSMVTFASDSSSEQQTVDFTVDSVDATVSGVVVRPDGTPQQGGFVGLSSKTGRMGMSGGPIAGNGSFQIPVKAGTYQLQIMANDSRFSAPSSLTTAGITVSSGESKNLGTIQLVQNSATITGRVTRSDTGDAITGVRVHANSLTGTGWADAQTDSNGAYTLWVNAGVWRVGAAPLPTDPYGAADGMEINAQNDRVNTLNIQLTAADSIISGRTVLAGTSTAVTGVYGGAFAFTSGKGGSGGPLQGGTFQIRVPAGTYKVGVGLPPGGGYMMYGDPQSVTVASGETANVTVSLIASNSTIRGTLRLYPDGTPVTGLAAQVFAGNGKGAGSMADYEPSTGTYTLQVAPGTWNRHVELSGGGYMVRPGQQMAVTVNTGQDVTSDIQLVQASRTITGVVKDPNGLPLMGAFVSIEDPTKGGHQRFIGGTQTNGSGNYSISVFPAAYEVRAHARFDLGYQEPAPVNIDTSSTSADNVNFMFLASDATLNGQVTLNGAGVTGMVRASNSDGSGAMANTDSSGNYSMSLRSGSWSIEAVSHDSTNFYKTSPITATVTAGTTTRNFAVTQYATMAAATSYSFDSTQMQVLKLSDGTEIQIPAGALALSGNVTVSASPKAEIPTQGGVKPIGVGYTLTAVDSSGQSITKFLSNVTIVLHYTSDQLSALGISDGDLLASYWDETSSSWQSVSNVSINTSNLTVSIMVDHFTDYALTTKKATASADIPTPTPTATATPTNTPGPTNTPTPTATGSPVPTSTPTATTTGTPAPTNTPTPSPTDTPGTPTPTPTVGTATPTATSTPSGSGGGGGDGGQPVAPTSPVPTATLGGVQFRPVDARYFGATGFRANDDSFWDYFQKRGGLDTFGYPVSREFTLMGFKVQIFQRRIVQLVPDGGVATLNVLDPDIMPFTQINFAKLPPVDPALIALAPATNDQDYAKKVIAFVNDNVVDSWQGTPVNFLGTFNNTIKYQDAFPNGDGEPALIPLINLEMWGLPTSKPAQDPNNANFVYQRFQRGFMHYDATSGTTQGVLMADYFKAILTGQNLPPDLANEANTSKFYRQYDPTKPKHLARPEALLGTDLTDAFTPELTQQVGGQASSISLGLLAVPMLAGLLWLGKPRSRSFAGKR